MTATSTPPSPESVVEPVPPESRLERALVALEDALQFVECLPEDRRRAIARTKLQEAILWLQFGRTLSP